MNRFLQDFMAQTNELLESPRVREMARWNHHGTNTCLEHSLFVAYVAYRAARVLGLDAVTAARGGLLHDLYLYDPKDAAAHPGNQCIDHPRAAARNAAEVTQLSKAEENIILSHMWPLGGPIPRSPEAVLVNVVDTVCAGLELTGCYRPARLRKKIEPKPYYAKA